MRWRGREVGRGTYIGRLRGREGKREVKQTLLKGVIYLGSLLQVG